MHWLALGESVLGASTYRSMLSVAPDLDASALPAPPLWRSIAPAPALSGDWPLGAQSPPPLPFSGRRPFWRSPPPRALSRKRSALSGTALIRRSALHGDQPLWRLAVLAPCRFGAIYLHISQPFSGGVVFPWLFLLLLFLFLFFIAYLGRGHAPSSSSLYFSYT
jgi:hypothetical protein